MNNRTLGIIGVSVLGTLVLIGSILYVLRPSARRAPQAGALPTSITEQIRGFTVFYPQPLPAGYRLDSASPTYSNQILTYRLTSAAKQAVTITVQAVPPSLETSTIVGKESVPTNYGSASLSLVEGRTVGYLITKDKRSFIIMNTSDSVDSDSFKSLLRSLKPLKP